MSTVFATKQRLNDARQALHDLQLGRSARKIKDQNGEEVEFTAANVGRLQAYILQMEQDIASGCNGTPAMHTSPVGFLF